MAFEARLRITQAGKHLLRSRRFEFTVTFAPAVQARYIPVSIASPKRHPGSEQAAGTLVPDILEQESKMRCYNDNAAMEQELLLKQC